MQNAPFKFELGQKVHLVCSDEIGTVQGRAEYLNETNSYYVLYKSADGCQTRAWWNESEIEAVG